MNEKKWTHSVLFNESYKFEKENEKIFLQFFKNNKGNNNKILDLGCSDGGLSLKTIRPSGATEVHGIDINRSATKKARESGVITINSDLNRGFPFKNETFDVISANQVLEHVWNTDNFFMEINRILKPGGYAVISTPNLSSFHSIFFIILGQQPPIISLTDIQVGNFLFGNEAPGHYKAFNFSGLKDLSKYYGFEVEKIKGYGFYFLPIFIQKLFELFFGRYAVFISLRIRKMNVPRKKGSFLNS